MIIMGQFSPVLHKNICYECSLEEPCQGASNEYPQHTSLWRLEKLEKKNIADHELSPNTPL